MSTHTKLGIVAGSGALPGFVIELCRKQGREFFVVASEGDADRAEFAHVPHIWARRGALRRIVNAFRKEGVSELIFVGGIRRPTPWQLRPDWYLFMKICHVGWQIFRAGDESLLKILVREMQAIGFSISGVHELFPELLAREGLYGSVRPDHEAELDIELGVQAAHEIGRADIGQAVVVQRREVLGVEDRQGTDALIARCASKQAAGAGGILVKVAKPSQQRKIDLPTIGVDTVRAAAAAGLRGIAIEAGSALVVDREEVARTADAADIFVVGVRLGSDPAG
jgi:DUF1009 family protein